jgi:hypothetical protein
MVSVDALAEGQRARCGGFRAAAAGARARASVHGRAGGSSLSGPADGPSRSPVPGLKASGGELPRFGGGGGFVSERGMLGVGCGSMCYHASARDAFHGFPFLSMEQAFPLRAGLRVPEERSAYQSAAKITI